MKKLIFCGFLGFLAACGGNPLNNEIPGSGGGAPTPPVVPSGIVVPTTLQNSIQSVVYTPGPTPTLQVAITGLDTTPLLATWTRNAALDLPGYTAFSIQEDALDRLFIGLAATSADGSVNAVLAGDGGQFNRVFQGTVYNRAGGFTPPAATGSGPATGQVSYAGTYAGILNGGGDGSALLPVPGGTDPSVQPTQAARVAGDAFVNANFADNSVGGSIYNRVVVDAGFGLQSIVLIPDTILADGTFTGSIEPENEIGNTTGEYGGVFGGVNAAAVAGAISLERVNDDTGTEIPDALERGIFVLNQCGLSAATDAPGCAGAAP